MRFLEAKHLLVSDRIWLIVLGQFFSQLMPYECASRFTKRHFVWHKNTQTWGISTLASLVFHALFKSPLLSEIEATFQTVFQFSFFFKTFTLLLLYNFCLFPKNCRKFHQYNHATKENRRTSWVRWFCFHPPLRSKSHSKWKMEAIWRPLN